MQKLQQRCRDGGGCKVAQMRAAQTTRDPHILVSNSIAGSTWVIYKTINDIAAQSALRAARFALKSLFWLDVRNCHVGACAEPRTDILIEFNAASKTAPQHPAIPTNRGEYVRLLAFDWMISMWIAQIAFSDKWGPGCFSGSWHVLRIKGSKKTRKHREPTLAPWCFDRMYFPGVNDS